MDIFKGFPAGTFLANMLGTLFIGALFAARGGLWFRTPSNVTCQVLSGLGDGFCGCLTTVSTFIVEMKQLYPRRACIVYVTLSILIGQMVLYVFILPSRPDNLDLCSIRT